MGTQWCIRMHWALGLVAVAVSAGPGCTKSRKSPVTSCERYVDVRLRCEAPPKGAEYLAGYRKGAEEACEQIVSAGDTLENAYSFDELRCTDRSLDCGEFYECRGREWNLSYAIQEGLTVLAELTARDKPLDFDPHSPCFRYQLAKDDLQKAERPRAAQLIRDLTPLCARDAWVEATERTIAAFEQQLDTADESRRRKQDWKSPDTYLCIRARSYADKISAAHRDEPPIKALAERVAASCSESALADLAERRTIDERP